MKRFEKIAYYLLVIASMTLLVVGCASKSKQVSQESITQDVTAEKSSNPEWVLKGSGAFKGEDGKAFYGVGSIWGIQNPSLARTTADNRARAEIAKIFKTYTAALMKDFQASTMAGDADVTSEEQHVEQTIKTFTKAELAGVEIVDHWKNTETGEYFSLARMNFTMFEDHLKNAKTLSETVRNRVLEDAEKAFNALEMEEARHE